jgi:hypothetical protein
MHAHKERSEWGSVYARNEAMKDVFARCLKKTAVQVCTLITIDTGLGVATRCMLIRRGQNGVQSMPGTRP